jgi:hypothetical protein
MFDANLTLLHSCHFFLASSEEIIKKYHSDLELEQI